VMVMMMMMMNGSLIDVGDEDVTRFDTHMMVFLEFRQAWDT
jgi:hypothetical protein